MGPLEASRLLWKLCLGPQEHPLAPVKIQRAPKKVHTKHKKAKKRYNKAQKSIKTHRRGDTGSRQRVKFASLLCVELMPGFSQNLCPKNSRNMGKYLAFLLC